MIVDPVTLPPKTAKDQAYLQSKGWRLIGKRRAKYGWHFYWDRWDGASWSRQYIQGHALDFQRGMDKRARSTTVEKQPDSAGPS